MPYYKTMNLVSTGNQTVIKSIVINKSCLPRQKPCVTLNARLNEIVGQVVEECHTSTPLSVTQYLN